MRLREENDRSWILLVDLEWMRQDTDLPGTSSVRGSLSIPRFHFLRGAELFSFCGEGVVVSSLPCAGAGAGAGSGCFRKPPSMPIMPQKKPELQRCTCKQLKVAGEGLIKLCRRSTVNTVRYVSLLPHGTATATFRSGSTMVQVRDRQLTRCRA